MTKRPKIGVTGNHVFGSPSWFCIRLSIWLCGGQAIRISIKHNYDMNQLQGMVISGGDDIHPSLYGEEAMPKATYDQPRDELEQEYIQHAVDKGLPILGICRGYQLINAVHGGSLHTDIREMRNHTSNWATILPRKTGYLDKNSKLYSIVKKSPIKINSLHHQAIDSTADGFKAVAWDKDDFIQGIESNQDKPILGVQWHPEYMFYLKRHRAFFSWLVRCAQHTHQKG